MKIIIETIPHANHRYPTVGDWFMEGGTLHIKVSALSDPRYEALVAVHELVEVLTCQRDGVSEKAVDAFDIAYEQARQLGDESEPGDDPQAPYVNQHCLATGIERILAQQWGVKWKDYENELAKLP